MRTEASWTVTDRGSGHAGSQKQYWTHTFMLLFAFDFLAIAPRTQIDCIQSMRPGSIAACPKSGLCLSKVGTVQSRGWSTAGAGLEESGLVSRNGCLSNKWPVQQVTVHKWLSPWPRVIVPWPPREGICVCPIAPLSNRSRREADLPIGACPISAVLISALDSPSGRRARKIPPWLRFLLVPIRLHSCSSRL
jgi:hypothetical protein